MRTDPVVGDQACFLALHLPDRTLVYKSHVKLFRFSRKEGVVHGKIYVDSWAFQYADCKAVEIVGVRD